MLKIGKSPPENRGYDLKRNRTPGESSGDLFHLRDGHAAHDVRKTPGASPN